MPIALLKFPYDLLGEVFKQCNPLELYFLSKCSKKAQKTVKLGGSMNWKICYWGREQILIWRDDLNYIFDPTDKPEDYFKIESCESMKIPKEGAFDMFFYLIETFGMCIVKSLEIQSDLNEVVNVLPLISQMNITKELQCRNSFPPNFDYQLDKYPNSIRIYDSPWFGINQLLKCPCTRIELGDSGLSNQDLNVFFREWKKTEAFPNLRYLEVSSKNIDNLSSIFDMVPPITRRENPRIRFSAWLGEDDYIFIWDPDRDMWEDEELDPSDDERYEDEEFDDEEFDDEETEDEEPDEEESDEEGFDGEEPES
ncbi:hypothetical protein L3Y34_016165 [Caenorhabditis briggsae]|uniref:F-box domain-containing protein n=1 Tax=Caenorhabditis briggsae TaxID=6238 RepID=A0AAE9DWF2_CAEBR|nr:hypothetical protein L3Y34_016165 [Caenorhabditis briggsae]